MIQYAPDAPPIYSEDVLDHLRHWREYHPSRDVIPTLNHPDHLFHSPQRRRKPSTLPHEPNAYGAFSYLLGRVLHDVPGIRKRAHYAAIITDCLGITSPKQIDICMSMGQMVRSDPQFNPTIPLSPAPPIPPPTFLAPPRSESTSHQEYVKTARAEILRNRVKIIGQLIDRDGRQCAYFADCGRAFPTWTDYHSSEWHIDHIHPLSLWGANNLDNLQLLCRPHNHRKHGSPEADLDWIPTFRRGQDNPPHGMKLVVVQPTAD